MITRPNWNFRLHRAPDETNTEFVFRHVRNLVLQVKKQHYYMMHREHWHAVQECEEQANPWWRGLSPEDRVKIYREKNGD